MQRRQQQNKAVLQQKLALDVYLKTLLEKLPVDDGIEPEPVRPVANTVINTGHKAAEVFTTNLAQPDLPPHPLALDNIPVPVVSPAVQSLVPMPDWAQHEFSALYFKLAQLIIAVPLVELHKTLKFSSAALTKIPGQPGWFLGLIEVQDKKVGVLDGGHLILGRSFGKKRDLKENPYKHLLILQEGAWGLTCDEILTIGKLMPEKVRWRSVRNSRPWLIGTIIADLTAIIDVQQLLPKQKM